MANPFTPSETSTALFTEKTWLQGCVLGSVAYGVQFSLFIGCITLLWKRMNSSNRRGNIGLMVYVCVMFSLGTIFMVSLAAFTQLAFITDREYPGGPDGVENDLFSIPIDEGGNVVFVIQSWLADALLVWRCTVIYRGSRVPTWAVATGPSIILAGSIVTGILWQIQVSTTSVHATQVVNWTIPFLSLTISLNILVTLAIVLRIQMYRRRLTAALKNPHTSQYIGMAATIVESAAIFSSFALVVLITFAINSPVFNIFLQSMSQVQICTTLLIIYRVAQGEAWSARTTESVLGLNQANYTIGQAEYAMQVTSVKTLPESGDHGATTGDTASFRGV